MDDTTQEQEIVPQQNPQELAAQSAASQIPAALLPTPPPDVGATLVPQVAQQVSALQPVAPPQFDVPQAPQVVAPATPTPEQSYSNEVLGLNSQQKKSNDALAQAAQEKAKYDVEQQNILAGEAADNIKHEKQQALDRAKAVDTEMKTLGSIQQEFQDSLGQKINPNKYWESKDSGQKILSGVALFLGGLAGGLSGKGGNVAVDIIEKNIDRDIDAQKENIRNFQNGKLKQYDMEQNTLAQMYKKFGNEDQAEAATRLLRLQQVQYMVNANASKYASPEIKERAKQANLLIDQQAAQLKYQIANVSAQKAAQQQLNNFLNKGDARNIPTGALNQLPKELQEKYVPGYGFASNSDNAKKFQDKRTEIEPLINQIDEVQAILKNYSRVTDPIKKEEIETKIDSIRGRLGAALLGTKRFSADEIEFVTKALGNPAGYLKVRPIADKRFDTFKKVLQSELNENASDAGLPLRSKASAITTFKPGQ